MDALGRVKIISALFPTGKRLSVRMNNPFRLRFSVNASNDCPVVFTMALDSNRILLNLLFRMAHSLLISISIPEYQHKHIFDIYLKLPQITSSTMRKQIFN
jgi:hypothetical protein